MTQSISIELKQTPGGEKYFAVVMEHEFFADTYIRVETYLPRGSTKLSLAEIQADLWQRAAEHADSRAKSLRQYGLAAAPNPESNPGS